MLKMPANSEPFKILSLDPGSSHLGVAILLDQLDGSDVTMDESFTVHLKDTCPMYSELGDLHGNRVIRLMQLGDAVLDLLRTHRPHAVIVEANYLGRFATAFAALVECVAMVRSAVYMYDPFMPLFQVDPSTAKINAGMERIKGTDKEDVRRAMRKRKGIKWNVDLESLDEHSVDACAIGLYCAEHITPRVMPAEPVKKIKVKKERKKRRRGKRR
ncbi:holliday junction resolvase [Pseudomonas phage D6]|nr:holliday junction resolvase [Pseudomonas phage D6]